MADFSTDLAERCVQGCVDPKGEDFIHVRDRSAVAVLSVSPREVHCPIGGALALVRGALAGLIDEGIEEGRRQAGGASPEALEAAREEGRRLGWLEALGAVAREAEQRREAWKMACASAERARLDFISAEVVRDVLAAAAPGGGR